MSQHPNTRYKHWTKQEDEVISLLVTSNPKNTWKEIARILSEDYKLNNRTGKQCRERWHNYLNPSINKNPLSVEEQILLFSTHQKVGNQWAHITSLMPGRTENFVKNTFYSTLRKQFRKWDYSEPVMEQIKKYEHLLTSQILTALHKRLAHIQKKQAKKQYAKAITLDDIDPILEESSIYSSETKYSWDFSYIIQSEEQE